MIIQLIQHLSLVSSTFTELLHNYFPTHRVPLVLQTIEQITKEDFSLGGGLTTTQSENWDTNIPSQACNTQRKNIQTFSRVPPIFYQDKLSRSSTGRLSTWLTSP